MAAMQNPSTSTTTTTSSSSRPNPSMSHAALLSTRLLLTNAIRRRPFCALPLHLCANSTNTTPATTASSSGSACGGGRRTVLCGPRARTTNRPPVALLKEEWLDSLSFPFDERPRLMDPGVAGESESDGSDAGWVIGVDPDVSGAVALLKPDAEGCCAQVFDTPHLQVLVGKRVRKRLDTRSIIQLLRSFGAPIGTTVYIEQSIPFPQDGKQGWWSGGFTYGLWLGILVASGFSVVPVTSHLWKDHFELYGSSITKDDSRKTASILFPSLHSSLKRKKDHGRAEALLIAAYGKGLKIHPELVVSQGASQ